METWLANRYPLETLYYGRDYGDAIDRAIAAEPGVKRVTDAPVEASAALSRHCCWEIVSPFGFAMTSFYFALARGSGTG